MLNINEWCDTRYLDPVNIFKYVLNYRIYFSAELQRLLLNNNVYLATHNHEKAKDGFSVFECIGDHLSTELIDQLRKRQALFIFDLSMEGNLSDFPIDQSVYNTIKKYNLPPDCICVLAGTDSSPRYKELNFLYFPQLIMFSLGSNPACLRNSYDRRNILTEQHHGKYFSAMSLSPRYWRAYAVYHLLNSDIADRSIITFGEKISAMEPKYMEDFLNARAPIISEFEEATPRIGIGYKGEVSRNLHVNVLFHLALETSQDLDTIFYTEKTFKSIISETPMLIWAMPGMNTTEFEAWGFEPYTDWFDLSFDQETDIDKRWHLLQNELIRVCDLLDNLTPDQRLEWSLQNPRLMKHNKRQLLSLINLHCDQFKEMLKKYFE